MRELIRPALFMIARTGLFLAVLAWIVGQMWQGEGHVYLIVGAIDRSGFGVGMRMTTVGIWTLTKHGDWAGIEEFLGGTPVHENNPHLSLGVIAFQAGAKGLSVAIRHWLNVTIFALFYGVLKWVYRKRETALQADG